nr:glutamine--tRNA ligase [Betaproteobacteria bacterium]
MAKEHAPLPLGSNFIRGIIERDLETNKYATKHWAGSPGDATHQQTGQVDTAKIRTRFPPEPNGYLHIGHAKSVFLNFGLAQDYNGICHLRFDDTNPEKESQEYVDSITEMVQWLGFNWENNDESNLYFASNYFDDMFRAAELLIQHDYAYVDSQTADEMRENRGTLTEPGKDSPYRTRTIEENLTLFREMRDGKHADGSHILRAKINMASPNFNLRDPAIYRIRRAHHHNTGDKWCIYPMYTFAHPIEDALETITHSICTLEFEDQRPFYDWLMKKLVETGMLAQPVPKQHEFARLNLTYVVLSKRKLIQLVEEKHVAGWDDPRLPTLA